VKVVVRHRSTSSVRHTKRITQNRSCASQCAIRDDYRQNMAAPIGGLAPIGVCPALGGPHWGVWPPTVSIYKNIIALYRQIVSRMWGRVQHVHVYVVAVRYVTYVVVFVRMLTRCAYDSVSTPARNRCTAAAVVSAEHAPIQYQLTGRLVTFVLHSSLTDVPTTTDELRGTTTSDASTYVTMRITAVSSSSIVDKCHAHD